MVCSTAFCDLFIYRSIDGWIPDWTTDQSDCVIHRTHQQSKEMHSVLHMRLIFESTKYKNTCKFDGKHLHPISFHNSVGSKFNEWEDISRKFWNNHSTLSHFHWKCTRLCAHLQLSISILVYFLLPLSYSSRQPIIKISYDSPNNGWFGWCVENPCIVCIIIIVSDFFISKFVPST